MKHEINVYSDESDPKYEPSDKKVCSGCVNNTFMDAFIKKHGHFEECDFCGNEESCIPVNTLMKRFSEFVDFFYEDAAESSPVDHGEYVFPTIDMYDLIDEKLYFLNDDLLHHIHECFYGDMAFCEKINAYGNYCMEHFEWTWDSFARQLKHQMRFFFWKDDDSSLWNDMPPYKILYDIAEGASSFGFIGKLRANSILYRARVCGEYQSTESELGAPPPEIAPNNRMSPAGISLFYASQDAETCIKELNLKLDQSAIIGKWKTCRDMLFLDLSRYTVCDAELPDIDVFNTEKLHMFPFVKFFAGFLEDVNKNFDPNATSYEYVPTQVLSEFFRCVYKTPSGEKLSGIIYPSSKCPGGLNYAVFCGNSECLPSRDQWVSLMSTEIRTCR